MDRERWQHLERLYHATLAQPIEERTAFLVEACREDDALRQEVQALLDAPATADGVFAGPAVAIAAPIAGGQATSALTGRRLGVHKLKGATASAA